MKRTLRTLSLLLILCFALSLIPTTALAGSYFPKLKEADLGYAEATVKELETYDKIVSLVSKIKPGAKYSSSTIKKIDTYIKSIDTPWLKGYAKHQKAVAYQRYGKPKDAIKLWQELEKQWKKDKNWDQLCSVYESIGDTYALYLNDSKNAKAAYNSALALEKESRLSLDTTAKKRITKSLESISAQPKEQVHEIPPLTISVKEKQQLSIEVDGKKVSAVYSSSDKNIAKVDSKGTVTGVKAGEATITAKAGNNTFTCIVSVIGTSNSSDVSSSDYAEEVLRLVNIERKKAGVSALTLDVTLTKAANIRARESEELMVDSHMRPDGRSCETVFREVGIDISQYYWGENVFSRRFGKATPADAVSAWMNSPGHKATMLKPVYRKLGVGIWQNDSGASFWVQEFTS